MSPPASPRRNHDTLRSIAKAVIPAAAISLARRTLRDRKIAAALEPLRRWGEFTRGEATAFRSAWGNEGFAGDASFLYEAATLIALRRATVLECGTGATTLIAAVLAERYGFEVYCLEQDPQWAAHVRYSLARERLDRVRILDAPLIRYDGYVWYDVGGLELPSSIDTVICDGPYVDASWGEPYYSAWRRGILPFMSQRPRGAILIDDVDDRRAPAALASWQRDFGATCASIADSRGECGLLSLGEPCPVG